MVNIIAVTEVQITFPDADSNSFVCAPRNEIAKSYSNSVFHFPEELPYCVPERQHHFILSPVL